MHNLHFINGTNWLWFKVIVGDFADKMMILVNIYCIQFIKQDRYTNFHGLRFH